MIHPFLALVLVGFSTFIIVIASVYAYVKLGDRKAAKASARQVAPVVAAPRVAEAVDVGDEVRETGGMS
jgi:hypothetical protein